MNVKLIFLFSTALLLNTNIAFAAENEYGIVNAWFNGKNATVEGFSMKISEPAEIKIEVISKINCDVLLTLREPGTTKAFDVVSGPSKLDGRIDNLKVDSGWSKTYTWVVTPNGAWKNGNAPINIVVEFYKGMNDKIIQFTIANPYILDEQYPDSTPVQTTGAAQPSPTGTTSEPKPAPFLPAIGAIAVILGVWMWKRGKKASRHIFK